jgi:hypothetical protein
MNIVKTCLCLGAVFLIFSCDDDQPEYQEGRLPITAFNVQSSMIFINQVIVDVPLNVQAPDGCWSDLSVDYENFRESHYRVRGLGKLDLKADACPEVLITLDTTLEITLPGPGTYYFEANQAPFEVLYDTLIVE